MPHLFDPTQLIWRSRLKTIIAGNRSVDISVEELEQIVESSGFTIDVVLSGGTVGVDQTGEKYANRNNIELKVSKPNWRIGKSAGLINNESMANEADALIVVYDGISKGTKHIIDTMRKKGKKVYIYYV